MRRLFAAALYVLALAAPLSAAPRKPARLVEESAGEVSQQDTDLIDTPTASVLDYGSASARVRFFSGGGALGWLGFGVFQKLNIGASLNVDNVIGSATPIRFTRPELQVKYRFYDGSAQLPALAAGFDGQGLFYDRTAKKYAEQQRGIYVVGTKELFAGGLFFHGGANVGDFEENKGYGFLGVNWNIEDKVSLIGEWDAINNSKDSRANAGIRVYASPFLQIDFMVREIGDSTRVGGVKRSPERIVQMKYAGNF